MLENLPVPTFLVYAWRCPTCGVGNVAPPQPMPQDAREEFAATYGLDVTDDTPITIPPLTILCWHCQETFPAYQETDYGQFGE